MMSVGARPVVHLELHTGDLALAHSFYAGLCGWRGQQITTPGAGEIALWQPKR